MLGSYWGKVAVVLGTALQGKVAVLLGKVAILLGKVAVLLGKVALLLGKVSKAYSGLGLGFRAGLALGFISTLGWL